jgi:hypothetical protein
MTTLSRTALLFVSAALVATTIACSIATPEPTSDSTEDIKGDSSSTDPADASYADASYADADAHADAHASPACCDPTAKPDGYYPEGISCCADNAWHASLGAGPNHTCAAHGGVGTVCEATPRCGGPPMNAFCAACPAGNNGYKQINGQPTCECCTSTP